MRFAAVAVCLLAVSAGCVVQTTTTETGTPSTPEPLSEVAETPEHPETPSSAEYDVNVVKIENIVHKEMNERRQNNGLKPLNRSKKLDAIARYKSWDMAQRDYFAHRGPNGISHSVLRSKYNASCPTTGQNIHLSRYDADSKQIQEALQHPEKIATSAVNSLMNSTGHRKNILDPDYELQGIGIFVDENGTVFLTQEFCG